MPNQQFQSLCNSLGVEHHIEMKSNLSEINQRFLLRWWFGKNAYANTCERWRRETSIYKIGLDYKEVVEKYKILVQALYDIGKGSLARKVEEDIDIFLSDKARERPEMNVMYTGNSQFSFSYYTDLPSIEDCKLHIQQTYQEKRKYNEKNYFLFSSPKKNLKKLFFGFSNR